MEENTTKQLSSVAQSCLTLRDPMNRSMPGLPVVQNIHTQGNRALLHLKSTVHICVRIFALDIRVCLILQCRNIGN